MLHGNCKKKKKKKEHCKRRLERDYIDKVGIGYPTTRFSRERERRDIDNRDHFTTLINFISFYSIFVPRGSNAASLFPP